MLHNWILDCKWNFLSNSLAYSNRWQNSTVEVIFWFMLLNWSNILSQVMSVKAIGIAIKLTLDGANQFVYFQTWIFTMVAVSCIITSLNYLNMVSITLGIFMWIFFLAWLVFNYVFHLLFSIRTHFCLLEMIHNLIWFMATFLATALVISTWVYWSFHLNYIACEFKKLFVGYELIYKFKM
jgi:hypothetical protein